MQVVPLNYCSFRKNDKTLVLSSEFCGMPREFVVKSHVTGKEVKFIPVTYGDPLYDEDGWDGEMSIYRPVIDLPNVDHLVIINEY